MKNLGAIAPNYKADLLLFDNLKDFKPSIVIKDGNIVAENGEMVVDIEKPQISSLRGTVNIRWLDPEDIKIIAKSDLDELMNEAKENSVGKVYVITCFSDRMKFLNRR